MEYIEAQRGTIDSHRAVLCCCVLVFFLGGPRFCSMSFGAILISQNPEQNIFFTYLVQNGPQSGVSCRNPLFVDVCIFSLFRSVLSLWLLHHTSKNESLQFRQFSVFLLSDLNSWTGERGSLSFYLRRRTKRSTYSYNVVCGTSFTVFLHFSRMQN